jgi:hypothetical protein
MTTSGMTDARIESYLNRLQSALRGVAPEQREDILLRNSRTHYGFCPA